MRDGTDIVLADMGELEDMQKAKDVADLLDKTYSGYGWMVACARGVISVKEMHLSQFGQYGFVLAPCATYSEMRVNAILAGGELLERAGLPQKYNGTVSTRLEGADPNKARDPKLKQLAICEALSRTCPPEHRQHYIGLASQLRTSIEHANAPR